MDEIFEHEVGVGGFAVQDKKGDATVLITLYEGEGLPLAAQETVNINEARLLYYVRGGTNLVVVAYEKPVIVDPPPDIGNLVLDPHFDTGEGWRKYTDEGNPRFGLEDGSAWIKGYTTLDRGRWMTGRDLPVSPDETYALEGLMRGDINQGHPAIRVNFWDADRNYIDGSRLAAPQLSPGVDGVSCAATEIKPPLDAVFARIECRAWGIVGQVWFDYVWFGVEAAPPTFKERLLEKAAEEQTFQLNPDAALQKAIDADEFWVTSNEFAEMDDQGNPIVAQRAEYPRTVEEPQAGEGHPATGEVRVYYAVVGDWGNIKYVVRE